MRSVALAPFRVRSFRFQWPADLTSSWAFEMESLILGWYILVETRSVGLLALFGALQYLGSLAAPLFGVAGDRLGHRNLMCIMRATFILLAATAAALALAGMLTPAYVFVIALLGGMLRSSDPAVRNALIAQTVPAGQLTGALAISRTTIDSARLAGALAGAGAGAALGIGPTYIAVTVLYGISFLLSLQVSGAPARTGAPAAAQHPWQDLCQGFAYIWRAPTLLGAMTLAFLINLLAYPFALGLLPYVAKEIYGTDQIGLGYLVAAFSLGGIAGSLVVGLRRGPLRAARAMIVAALAWFVALLAFAWVTDLRAGIVLLILTGLFQSICAAPLSAVMLHCSDEAFRGRVMGMRMLAVWGLPAGLLIAGPLISAIGFAATGTIYALAGLVLTLWMTLYWRAQLWRASAPANR